MPNIYLCAGVFLATRCGDGIVSLFRSWNVDDFIARLLSPSRDSPPLDTSVFAPGQPASHSTGPRCSGPLVSR